MYSFSASTICNDDLRSLKTFVYFYVLKILVAHQRTAETRHLHNCTSRYNMIFKEVFVFVAVLSQCVQCFKDAYCDFNQPGKCFLFDETQHLNLSSSIDFCSSLNLTLASISSKTENGIVRSMIGIGEVWINSLAIDFSDPVIQQWTRFHSKCTADCCGVFMTGDGIWRDDKCTELHGVVCQKYVLTHMLQSQPDINLRTGKSFGDEEPKTGKGRHDHKSESYAAIFRRITPFLMVFTFFFVTSCAVFFCLTRMKRSYATIRGIQSS